MFGKRKHVKIIKHHRTSAVYLDGRNDRYLNVDMKISTQSQTGRRIARETAVAILNQVGQNEAGFELLKGTYDKPSKTHIQDPPAPPSSFTREEGKAAVRTVIDKREQSEQHTDEPVAGEGDQTIRGA